jgi:hypothetical protein
VLAQLRGVFQLLPISAAVAILLTLAWSLWTFRSVFNRQVLRNSVAFWSLLIGNFVIVDFVLKEHWGPPPALPPVHWRAAIRQLSVRRRRRLAWRMPVKLLVCLWRGERTFLDGLRDGASAPAHFQAGLYRGASRGDCRIMLEGRIWRALSVRRDRRRLAVGACIFADCCVRFAHRTKIPRTSSH